MVLVFNSFRSFFITISNASQSTLSKVSRVHSFLHIMHLIRFSPCVASRISVRMLDAILLPWTVIVALAAGRCGMCSDGAPGPV